VKIILISQVVFQWLKIEIFFGEFVVSVGAEN